MTAILRKIQLATGALYQPSISVISHYFEKRRSFAMGIATSGAALGGVIYPSKQILATVSTLRGYLILLFCA